jgi:ribosome maturation factor RimP
MALNLEQIRRMADRVAASLGLDVVELEHLGGSKNRVLRVFIERDREGRARMAEEARLQIESGVDLAKSGALPAAAVGGVEALDRLAWITHEDCEAFSRDFGTVLDVEDLISGAEYTLEVSSPGLDRKLLDPADYRRFKGNVVKLQTFAPLAGNRHWQGRLTEVRESGIVLELPAVGRKSRKKGAMAEQTLEIAFADVEKANLVPEF